MAKQVPASDIFPNIQSFKTACLIREIEFFRKFKSMPSDLAIEYSKFKSNLIWILLASIMLCLLPSTIDTIKNISDSFFVLCVLAFSYGLIIAFIGVPALHKSFQFLGKYNSMTRILELLRKKGDVELFISNLLESLSEEQKSNTQYMDIFNKEKEHLLNHHADEGYYKKLAALDYTLKVYQACLAMHGFGNVFIPNEE